MSEQALQQSLDEYASVRQWSGSILVAQGARVIAERHMGMADRARQMPCARNTLYFIGSLTKQFVGAAILKIFHAKAIDELGSGVELSALSARIDSYLHRPVMEYLPSAAAVWSGAMPEWASRITVHQLLTHASGIAEYTDFPSFQSPYVHSPSVIELMAYVKDKPLAFAPGSQFAYNNSGYILLGVIAEAIMQQPVTVYLKQQIFEPLTMHETFFPEHGTVRELKQAPEYTHLARGYQFDPRLPAAPIEEVCHYVPAPLAREAGGMISTVLDLWHWNQGLFHGRLLAPFLLDKMLNNGIVTGETGGFYAYGLERREYASLGMLYFHRGSVDGYKSWLGYFPKAEISIICLTNVADKAEELIQEENNMMKTLPQEWTTEAKLAHVEVMLNARYPEITHNKDQYHATLWIDQCIEELESEYRDGDSGWR